ncbi:bifunctional protein-serine/threonine kinase/phosphatase [Oceanicola sp. D3]|nr:bifunctional protein-serine/threonine kinase/phosphatase [Oceanicola sp. D3]
MRVSLGQFSTAGRKPVNQDFHGAKVPTGSALTMKGIVLAVADGISSSPVSREASEMAVKALLTDYYATADAWSVQTAASRVISATNAWLHSQNAAATDDINTGRVCTLSALILKGSEAHIFQIGDSRVSRLTGGSLEPLTRDHRVTWSAGQHHLARAMGAAAEVEIDYHALPVKAGDIFVLTTDGVHEHLGFHALRDSMGQPSLDAVAEALAMSALAAGSDDNLTVQVLRIDALAQDDASLALDRAMLPVPPLPKSGQQIDGFRIVRPVQSTARSHVFLAVDEAGRQVALKVPTREMAEEGDYRQRFALEEWIARRIRSPHVVSASPAPDQRSWLYSVTEWVEGVTLRQWMTDTPQPSHDEVRDIIRQIAEGLRALHRRDMLHQDIRPENVMIDAEGTVKIIDLGSTTVAGVEEAAHGALGVMPGTFQYTAPEYLSGDTVSWRSDQYALAVIAYEMLTGRLPYGTQVARIRNRTDQRRLSYMPAHDDVTGVPLWMDAALGRALHPDPLRRYDALSEFIADLARPGAAYKARHHVPLAERNPLRFWQGVSALLAVLCVILTLQLAN